MQQVINIEVSSGFSNNSIEIFDLEFAVEFDSKKKGFLGRLLSKAASENDTERCVTYRVDSIDYPVGIECNSDNTFVSLFEEVGNGVVTQSVSVPYIKAKSGRGVKLYIQKNVLNIVESVSDEHEIVCHFSAIDSVTGDSKRNEIVFMVKVNRETFHPELFLDLEPQITYNRTDERTNLGNLLVYYIKSNSNSSIPNIDVSVTFILKDKYGKIIPDAVLAKKGEIQIVGGVHISNISVNERDQNGDESAACEVELYLDQTKLDNPIIALTDYELAVKGHYTLVNDGTVHRLEGLSESFKLHKEIVKTKLDITIEENGEVIHVGDKNCIHLTKRSFLPLSDMKTEVKVTLYNMAPEEVIQNAGLHLSGMTINEDGLDELFIRDKGGQSVESIINIHGRNLDILTSQSGIFIADGSSLSECVTLVFDPSHINYIASGKYDFEVTSTIDIAYWENKEGLPRSMSNGNLQHKTFMLIWHLYMLPHGEWLCLDYGSSAIVCKYGNTLLDLKKQKERLLQRDESLQKYKDDEMENDAKFLNSDIIFMEPLKTHLQGVSSLCSEQDRELPYTSQAVFLSPTSSLIRENEITPIPCLKILVGNEFLPRDIQYRIFEYYRKNDNDQVVLSTAEEAKDADNCILKINTIMAESYHVLFKYFVRPTLAVSTTINRLILTYPNTYTPYHREVLKRIAKQVFPQLRELEFVCESDAVAAYYMRHWKEYHMDVSKLKQSQGENVLVYDMGAGTLDLTFFRQKWNSDTCKHELEILGKIGIGKAGNYIDTVIAEIICKKLKIDSTISSVLIKGDGDTYSQRTCLKQVIKQKIKIALSNCSPQKITFTLQKTGGNTYNINTTDILEDEAFIECLNDCTIKVIENLRKYIGMKRPIIHTVIMSGRSCKLVPLQHKLEDAVRDCCRDGVDPEFITLDKPINFQGEMIADRQKTVVVEGAEIMAKEIKHAESNIKIKSHRLYATYGVIYTNTEGEKDYVELLNHQDSPYTDASSNDFNSDIKAIVIYPNSNIQLIQTYLSDSDTLKAFKTHDYEYITLMESYNTEEFGTHLRLRVKINELNNVTLMVNSCYSSGMPPKGMDLKNPINRKSLWPVVFN